MGSVARYQMSVVLLAAALLATLTVTLTGGDRAAALDGPVDVVYVATGRNFPDALAGSILAGTVGAPVLTVEPDGPLPAATVAALTSLAPDRIIVFGGPGAVSDAVVGALTVHARSGSVTRIAGGDRHGTAAAIADALPGKVHDSDLLDGLDAADFLRTTDAADFLTNADAADFLTDADAANFLTDADQIDADTLGGSDAAAYRTWPLQFQYAQNGASTDNVGGPRLDGFGTSPNYSRLVSYFATPPLAGDQPVTLTLALFTFNGECSVRLRVSGWTESQSGVSEFTVTFPAAGSNRLARTLTATLPARTSEQLVVERIGDHPGDTCDAQSIAIQGAYLTF